MSECEHCGSANTYAWTGRGNRPDDGYDRTHIRCGDCGAVLGKPDGDQLDTGYVGEDPPLPRHDEPDEPVAPGHSPR